MDDSALCLNCLNCLQIRDRHRKTGLTDGTQLASATIFVNEKRYGSRLVCCARLCVPVDWVSRRSSWWILAIDLVHPVVG